jgi:hypothetical protein
MNYLKTRKMMEGMLNQSRQMNFSVKMMINNKTKSQNKLMRGEEEWKKMKKSLKLQNPVKITLQILKSRKLTVINEFSNFRATIRRLNDLVIS